MAGLPKLVVKGQPEDLTPRQLLAFFTEIAVTAHHVNKSMGRYAPAKGARGLKHAARKRRHRELVRRQQRVMLCSYGESLKKEALT